MVIAGTGHRPQKLGGFGQEAFSKLVSFASSQLKELKPDSVVSGMALGWDMALAQASLDLQIPFIAAVPFMGQEGVWPEPSKAYYKKLIEAALKVVIVSTGGYAAYKMQVRNVWMIDNSDVLLALFNGTSGGTKNAVDYAIQNGKSVVNCWSSWEKYNGSSIDL